MIVHIFTAKRYHLVPGISKGFATTYNNDAQHRFLLFGNSSVNTSLYDNLFSAIGFKDYVFCQSRFQLFRELWRNRKQAILFHAGSYYQFVMAYLAGCKNINWVCWGSGTSIRNTLKSRITAPLTRWIYHQFNSIVTLMDDDRTTIIRDFKLNPDIIHTIPYASNGGVHVRDAICLRLLKERAEKRESKIKPVVLLGNNPSNINYYIKLMNLLKVYKGRIKVQCMMNYSVIKNEKYHEFIRLGHELFGDDFRSNEEFHEGDESYVCYMNTCDIYMCGNPNQTGLGAMFTTLKLGKKVYVTGKNYNWAKEHFGAIVYDIKDIADFDTFIKPLTIQEQMHNYNSIIPQKSENANLWRAYLKKIDSYSI